MVIIKRFINVFSLVIIFWMIGFIPYLTYYYNKEVSSNSLKEINYTRIERLLVKYDLAEEKTPLINKFRGYANTIEMRNFLSTFHIMLNNTEYADYLKDGEVKEKYIELRDEVYDLQNFLIKKDVMEETMEYGLINLGGILGSFFIIFILNYILFGRIQLFHQMRK